MSDVTNKEKAGVLLPPAVGYSFSVVKRLIKENRIALKYYPRFLVTFLINVINKPFRAYEKRFINPKIDAKEIKTDPIFILGHWRSGTTHLHNLLCEDPQMAYNTTFQGVFPDTLFNTIGRFIFESFTKLLIPGTRKGDNVKLRTHLPQEEEFALGSYSYFCYYYFWIFPKNTMKFYNQYVDFENVSNDDIREWKNNYKILIKKAIRNTGREIFISKNPPNTGRIEALLEMFPDAKFIHICRNPVEVFLSTLHFYRTMMPYIELHSVSDAELEDIVLKVYKKMMNKYFDMRKLIPAGNLVEISYEDIEVKPLEIIQEIYNKLQIGGFEESKIRFEEYLQYSKGYTKNKHQIKKDKLDRILSEWDFAMKELDYEIPENIEIID